MAADRPAAGAGDDTTAPTPWRAVHDLSVVAADGEQMAQAFDEPTALLIANAVNAYRAAAAVPAERATAERRELGPGAPPPSETPNSQDEDRRPEFSADRSSAGLLAQVDAIRKLRVEAWQEADQEHIAQMVERHAAAAVPAVPVEPDSEDDGVLLWMVGAELDVEMDNTAPGRLPARFVIGGVETDLRTATQLRDALDAAVRAARTRTEN